MNLYYQGVPGAYSSLAADYVASRLDTKIDQIIGLNSFEAVRESANGKHVAVIPVENSYAGTIHVNIYNFLLYNMKIIGEYILPINHCLLSKEKNLTDIHTVYSHPQALAQTYQYCKKHDIKQIVHADTAGAAHEVSQSNKTGVAAIASSKAGELYKLNFLDQSIQDQKHNQTRFIVITNEENTLSYSEKAGKTALLFQTKNVPGALYKSLGAFATNSIDLTKIESLPSQKDPFSYMFWIEAKGTKEDESMKKALEELSFYTTEIRILG